MSNISIISENLSKKYNIAKARNRNDTLRDQVANTAKSIFGRNKKDLDEQTFWALKDVSFEVKQGEVVGIIGQNGAGKSTLLKVLSQIVVPTYGCAQIYGRVGSLLEVGTGFHPEMTGRENIYLNGSIIGMKKEEISRRFDAIVDFAEIGKFLDVPVKRYSSGMYVRLAFAVAAHLEPEILLVDEVLAVGDVSFQKKCLGKIGSVAKGGRTVLFISHNMIAVNSLCQRVIWMKDGRVVEDGPASHVSRKYLGGAMTGLDSLEEVWDDPGSAPGDEVVRLHRVRVRSQDGEPSEPLTMQTPFQVEIEYWNLLPGAHLHITIHLYTAEGVIAFTTGSVQAGTGPLQAGLHRSIGYFPGNLLNSGLHRFELLVIKDRCSVAFNYESRVPIEIVDVRGREGGWYGKDPGVVQPLLPWTTEYLGDDSGNRSLSSAGPAIPAFRTIPRACRN